MCAILGRTICVTDPPQPDGTNGWFRAPVALSWNTIDSGSAIQSSNGAFHACTLGGLSGLTEPVFSSTRGAVANDGKDDTSDIQAAVLAVGGTTDWVDGYVARRTNTVSRLGELLDPFADRLYIVATLLGLALRGIIPWWLVALLAARAGGSFSAPLTLMNPLMACAMKSKAGRSR